MGDRGNIFFVDGREGDTLRGLYMYTHWSGSMLPEIARDALRRGRGRWGDSQYFARIVFCEMIQESVLEETGYGLGTFIGDNEHRIIRIDDLSGRVSFHRPGTERQASNDGTASWSYEEYLAADRADVAQAFHERGAEPEEAEEAEEPAGAKPVPLPKARAKVKPKGKAKPKAAPKRRPAAKAAPKARPAAKASPARRRAR